MAAAVLGDMVYKKFPFAPGVRPVGEDLAEMVLNRTWRPQLAVTGIAGLPPPVDAGNVLLPHLEAKLSLRLPPTVDGEAAGAAASQLLESDAICGAPLHSAVEPIKTCWPVPMLVTKDDRMKKPSTE